MPETHIRRRHALRNLLRERELDAMLVTNLLNIRYLTGFTGSNAALLVHAADGPGRGPDRVLHRRPLPDPGGRGVPDLATVIERASDVALAERAASSAALFRRTGFESHHVSVEHFDLLDRAFGAVELVRAPGLVEQLRVVKDEGEIESLRKACAVADRALADLVEQGGIRPGRTELEVARELESRMIEHGAEGPSFETIVAAGENSAVPHHRPGQYVLRDGDFVKIDFGALVEGYARRPARW